ncbi:Lysosomal Pro-Xaa carboxypeptidase [Entamoeba marina]
MLLFCFVALSLGLLSFQQVKFLGDTSVSDTETYFNSTQPIDHFDLTNSKTINIRYFINDTVYTKAAPMFVDLGGEGTQKASSLNGRYVINEYAEKYNSLMLSLEHRFYGDSLPEGGLSQENLGYLNAAQALEDYIHIINDVKNEYEVTGPVIVIGGSYSGNLATWIRQKYPNIVYAAIASSAPVKATTEFYEFMEVINNDMSADCSNAWGEAMEQLETLFATAEGKNTIEEMFNTCTPLESDLDFTIFLYQMQATFIYYPQYNGRYSLTIDGVCDMLTETNDSLSNLANFIEYANLELGKDCSDSNYESGLKALSNTLGEFEGNQYASTRSWEWQICSEYSYFQPINETLPFSKRLTNDYFYQMCDDLFNITKDTLDYRVKQTNMMYGSKAPKVTNVAFTSGSIDPWNPLAKHETIYNDIDCYASHIQGTAHCADIYVQKSDDPEQLLTQRQETAEFIDELITRYFN